MDIWAQDSDLSISVSNPSEVVDLSNTKFVEISLTLSVTQSVSMLAAFYGDLVTPFLALEV